MAAALSVLRPLTAIVAEGARESRLGSYGGGPRKCGSFRLPTHILAALSDFFTGNYVAPALASSMGSWSAQAEAWGGGRNGQDYVHLFDAERHCDHCRLFADHGPSADLTRCRDTLLILAETGEHATLTVLRRKYGRREPSARWHDFPEFASLIDLTPTVIELAEKRERARRAEAKLRLEEALTELGAAATTKVETMKPSWTKRLAHARKVEQSGRMRILHLEELAGSLPLDTTAVLREQLDAHVTRLPEETKGTFAARRIASNNDRAAFVAAITREADRLLADASTKFRAVWGDC